MKTRILSGLIMAPLLIVLYLGGNALVVACILMGTMGVREFYRGFQSLNIKPSYPIALGATVALYAIYFLDGDGRWQMAWLFSVTFASMIYLFSIEKRKLEDAMATILGIVYIVFFSFHMVLVHRDGPKEVSFLWIIVLAAFGTDIFAYFTGMLLGKHKLCPKISPKKTVEGAVGGTLAAMVLCGAYGYFFGKEFLVHFFVLGALGAIAAQLGDLTASVFKRKMGIKDYGNLIPGHGGILDRFDSILFVAPVIYYYMVLVIL